MGLSANLLLLVNEAEPWIRLWTVEAGERSGFLLSRSKYPDVWCLATLWGGWGPGVRVVCVIGVFPAIIRLWPRVSWHHPPWSAHHVSCPRGQHIMCHVQSQHPTLAPSKCRQQYLNLSSMLPKIPTEILGFQIRNILKNCISWGLENIFLSASSYLKAQDWILYEWITDFCPLFVIIGVYNYSLSSGKYTWELQ